MLRNRTVLKEREDIKRKKERSKERKKQWKSKSLETIENEVRNEQGKQKQK